MRHEDAKRREYGQRVLDFEHGVFTPLVLSTTDGMGREVTTFYKRLADMLSSKRNLPYSTLMGWLRCKISFAILRSAVMCIRTRYFTSSDSIVTSRRHVEIQSASEMSPYFTMTKCNKLFITYFTRSTERLPSLSSSILTI